MKKIFIITLFLFSLSGFSQDWVYSGQSKSGNKYYYKNEALSSNDGIVKIWTKETAKKVTYNKKEYYNCFSVILYEFDCVNSKYRELAFVVYDSSEKIIVSKTNNYLDVEWEYIVPNTAYEVRMNKICEMFNN